MFTDLLKTSKMETIITNAGLQHLAEKIECSNEGLNQIPSQCSGLKLWIMHWFISKRFEITLNT